MATKKKTAPAPKAVKYDTVTYKGHILLVVEERDDLNIGMHPGIQFGLKKASTILANLDLIRKFVSGGEIPASLLKHDGRTFCLPMPAGSFPSSMNHNRIFWVKVLEAEEEIAQFVKDHLNKAKE